MIFSMDRNNTVQSTNSTHLEEPMTLHVGQPAPDCVLESHLGQRVRLSEVWSKGNLALVFFPLAWTSI